MRDYQVGFRVLTIPYGAAADAPRIVIGPEVPAALQAWAASISVGPLIYRVLSAQVWWFDGTSFSFDAMLALYSTFAPGVPINVWRIKGAYNAVDDVVITEAQNVSAAGSVDYGDNFTGLPGDQTYRNVNLIYVSSCDIQVECDNRFTEPGNLFVYTDAVSFRARETVINTATGSRTNTAFANMPSNPTTTSFNKRWGAQTDLLAIMVASFFSNNTNTGAEFGISLGGTDYAIAKYAPTIPAAGARLVATGLRRITGIAAGAISGNLRWRCVTGAGTISTNSPDDVANVWLAEVPS